MKLTILTQYYPPELGAPQRRLSELSQRMIDAGHDVTVLTAMPNYPKGKIFEGYGGISQRDEIDGVEIIRSFIYPTQKASMIHRLSNYFSFVVSSAVVGTARMPKTDYLMVESPPLFLGMSAVWLNTIKRSQLIFNVSDLWPESAVRLGVVREGSRTHKLATWLEEFLYKRADIVTGQSRSILSDITDRFPDKKTFRLSNGTDVNKFGADKATAEAIQRLKPNGETVIIYAGLHGIAQGLDQAVQAAEQLRDREDIRFVLVGDGPEKQDLIRMANDRNLDNIAFFDPVEAHEIPPLLASADMILVPLKMYIPGAVPSKIYEAMASQKPVIVVAEGEPADIVTRNNTGVALAPGDIDGLVAAVVKLAEDDALRTEYAQNGRETVEEHFNRDKIVADFITFLEENLT